MEPHERDNFLEIGELVSRLTYLALGGSSSLSIPKTQSATHASGES